MNMIDPIMMCIPSALACFFAWQFYREVRKNDLLTNGLRLFGAPLLRTLAEMFWIELTDAERANLFAGEFRPAAVSFLMQNKNPRTAAKYFGLFHVLDDSVSNKQRPALQSFCEILQSLSSESVKPALAAQG